MKPVSTSTAAILVSRSTTKSAEAMPRSMAPLAAQAASCTAWAKSLLRLLEGW